MSVGVRVYLLIGVVVGGGGGGGAAAAAAVTSNLNLSKFVCC